MKNGKRDVGHTYIGIDSGKGYKEYAGFWSTTDYSIKSILMKETLDGQIKMQNKAYNTCGGHSNLIDPY